MKQPVMFGKKTPPGRRAGDCYLCNGDEFACDCQLSYVESEGATAQFTVGEDDKGPYLGVKIDGSVVSKSRFLDVEDE